VDDWRREVSSKYIRWSRRGEALRDRDYTMLLDSNFDRLLD